MLLFWLSPVLFRPIMRLFDEREKKIEGAQKEAQEMLSLAQEKSQTFDLEFNRARTKAREHLAELKHKADKEHQEILEQAKHEAKIMLKEADEALITEEKRVRIELVEKSDQVKDDIITALMGQKAKKMESV